MTWLDRLLAEPEALSAQEGEDHFDLILGALCAGLPPEDALGLREERAGILEFEAGFTRSEAERYVGLRSQNRERQHDQQDEVENQAEDIACGVECGGGEEDPRPSRPVLELAQGAPVYNRHRGIKWSQPEALCNYYNY